VGLGTLILQTFHHSRIKRSRSTLQLGSHQLAGQALTAAGSFHRFDLRSTTGAIAISGGRGARLCASVGHHHVENALAHSSLMQRQQSVRR